MWILRNSLVAGSAFLVAGWLAAGPTAATGQVNEIIAQQEMAVMANAMETVVIDTTRYVSLENLNDIVGVNTVRPYDSIRDQGGVYTIIPQDGFFLPTRTDLTRIEPGWNGPYVSFQLDRTQTDPTPYDLGSPLDPWGSPYYLFNPFGLIRGDLGTITLELYGDQFDRYTIVSLGADGIMSSDDIVREFGPGVTSTRLTSLRGDGVTLVSAPTDPPAYEVEAGTVVTLRGLNFGPAAENKFVRFDDTVIQEIHSWTTREIQITVPTTLTGPGHFSLLLNGSSTNTIHATITGGDTGVKGWGVY